MKPTDGNFQDRAATTPTVLITDTTRWSNAPRLAIGLAKAGCRVSALCPVPGHPLLKTHAVQESFPYSGLCPLDSLRAAIEAADPQIVIPCDDRGVQHLHELYALARRQDSAGSKLAELIERSLGSPDSHRVVSARYELLCIAGEEGLRVPATNPIRNIPDLEQWQEHHALPWVLKADGTWGGRGVRIAENAGQAKQAFLELTQPPGVLEVLKRLTLNRDRFRLWPWRSHAKPAIIVQSHIQGRPANCAVVCWQGKVLAGIGVEVVSAQGAKGPATVVRVVDNPEMMRPAEKLAARLRLSGFFGLDFMIEEGTGFTYLIEMNPRCTPLCHLQLGAGRDLVSALWAQLSGQRFHATPAVTENEMIAYFPQSWNCKSEFLGCSYQDVPQGEPELVEELLHPWSERSLVGRVADRMRQGKGDRAVEDCVFHAALALPELSVAVQRVDAD